MLLKGRVLLDMNKLTEASRHLHEALLIDQRCYDLYEALVNCLLKRGRPKEARMIAKSCRDFLGTSLQFSSTFYTFSNFTIFQVFALLDR